MKPEPAPGSHRPVLLMVDVVNPFDYPGGEMVLGEARRIMPRVRALADLFRAQEAPVIYVNDNFGRWRSSFDQTVAHCLAGAGKDVIESLRPKPEDYFVLKPHRSGFYNTPLEMLLRELKANHVVLAGVTTDMCVLATASDAHMRGYGMTVVSDATAAMDGPRHDRSLELMADAFDAKLRRVADLDLG